MRTNFTILIMALLLTALAKNSTAALVSDAGTASATEDTICENASSTLMLTGYTGTIQWQSFDGSIWSDETGTGSTTDSYTVTLTATTDFRAVVTDAGFPPDTSNVITITVGVSPPVATGDTRCGYGPVTLNATGGGTDIKWYDVPTGGIPLGSGNSFTTNVAATTNFYAAAVIGGGPPTPLTTTFLDNNGFNGNMFDITAINTVTIDSFAANLNPGTGTAEIWYRPGTHVGFTMSNVGWTQAGSVVYTSAGNGAPGTSIDIYVNVTIPAGQTYAFYVHGSAGIAYTNGTAVGNIYSQDANIIFMEGYGGDYFALGNFPRVFNGRIMYSAGCESNRTQAVATVTTSDAITLSATPPALCEGQSSAITVSSNNANYTYTWSPATGLSGTTGTSVTATPLSPITYTVIADDGTCGAIDSVFIAVGPASVAGTAAISSDTICVGTPAFLTLTGYTGTIQWQSFDGVNWVNETAPGSTTDNYEVSPAGATIYQAVVTSGGCDPDTTISLSLDVLALTDPTTVNDTICSPGFATLSASGTGVMQWFDVPTGGVSIHTGSTFNPNITTTTTYYVQASAGGQFQVGPADLSFGSQVSVAGNDFGLQFDVTQQVTINRVSVSPGITTGNIIVNLKDAGGAIINTATIAVGAFSGLTPVNLGFTVNPGTYRLELAAGSVALYHNTTNAVYPYTAPGSPVSITGYVNPNPGTGGQYYFFYNWEVSVGCTSNRIPVTAFVNPAPPVPVVSQNGTILTSSAPSNNQWNMNGNPIIGATGTTFDLTNTGSGTYTVTVTIDGCSSTSFPLVYTGIADELTAAGISVYPNPVKDVLSVAFDRMQGKTVLNIYNSLGELLVSKQAQDLKTDIDFEFSPGVYSLEIKTEQGNYVTNVVKL